jgi:uncharacterized Zn-binding protein involved in type VI secretion
VRRYFIVEGDKTTRDGTVLEGESRARNRGRPLAYHGARVYCPACKSEGYIVGDGPFRPVRLHGKQVAVENDLCICQCNPPPRLIRSQDNAFMSFDGEALARMGYAPDGRRLRADERARYIAFRLRDVGTLEGLDCTAYFDDGSSATGTFDYRNRVRFENPTGAACHRVVLSPGASLSRGTYCAALLTTLTA